MDTLRINYDNPSNKIRYTSYGCWGRSIYTGWALAVDHLYGDMLAPEHPLRVVVDYECSQVSRLSTGDLFVIIPSNLAKFKFSHPDFEELPSIKKYYKDKFDIKVQAFINRSEKKAIVVIRSKQNEHSLIPISLLPKYLNWFDLNIDEDTFNFLNAFETCNQELIDNVISEINERNTRNGLDNFFETVIIERRMQLEREIADIGTRIENAMVVIGDRVRERERAIAELNGLSDRDMPHLQEIIDARDFIKLENINNGILEFTVKGILSNWDEDSVRFVNDDYTYRNISRNKEKIRRLMQDIFINKKYKLKIAARYCVNIRSLTVNGMRQTNAMNDHMDNPHIARWACIGQYSGVLAAAIAKMDIGSVFDVCRVSTVSFNIAESPSLNYFIECLCNSSRYGKCLINKETGVELTVEEVLNEYD